MDELDEIPRTSKSDETPRFAALQADVGDRSAVQNLVSETIKQFGRLDVIVVSDPQVPSTGLASPFCSQMQAGLVSRTSPTWTKALRTKIGSSACATMCNHISGCAMLGDLSWQSTKELSSQLRLLQE